MRGGDNGWGDDASRTVLRYVPPTHPQAAEVGEEMVRRALAIIDHVVHGERDIYALTEAHDLLTAALAARKPHG